MFPVSKPTTCATLAEPLLEKLAHGALCRGRRSLSGRGAHTRCPSHSRREHPCDRLPDLALRVGKSACRTALAAAVHEELAHSPLGRGGSRGQSLDTISGHSAWHRQPDLRRGMSESTRSPTLAVAFLMKLAQGSHCGGLPVSCCNTRNSPDLMLSVRPCTIVPILTMSLCPELAHGPTRRSLAGPREHQRRGPSHRPTGEPRDGLDERRRPRCRCVRHRCVRGSTPNTTLRRRGPWHLLAEFMLPMRPGACAALLTRPLLPESADRSFLRTCTRCWWSSH
mmetsp:Transcript_32948/g.79418  ORF Transcript_32948/g.79418 Transcript_32948/m.79418 type:complete len:281 (-) Transcript_32948:174-1016(-)